MSALNIEVLDKKVVRMQTTWIGDVEIVISTLRADKPYVGLGKAKPEVGGVQDTRIAVIPKHRLELVANFLLTAHKSAQ